MVYFLPLLRTESCPSFSSLALLLRRNCFWIYTIMTALTPLLPPCLSEEAITGVLTSGNWWVYEAHGITHSVNAYGWVLKDKEKLLPKTVVLLHSLSALCPSFFCRRSCGQRELPSYLPGKEKEREYVCPSSTVRAKSMYYFNKRYYHSLQNFSLLYSYFITCATTLTQAWFLDSFTVHAL